MKKLLLMMLCVVIFACKQNGPIIDIEVEPTTEDVKGEEQKDEPKPVQPSQPQEPTYKLAGMNAIEEGEAFVVIFSVTEHISSDISVTWNFGDGSEEVVAGPQFNLHTFPKAGKYDVVVTFENNGEKYAGKIEVEIDGEGGLVGFTAPQTPDLKPVDPVEPSETITAGSYKKIADYQNNGNNNPLIVPANSALNATGKLYVFVKFVGEGPNGVFDRKRNGKDSSIPRDIQLMNGGENILTEPIMKSFGLKVPNKLGDYNLYSDGQGLGYDDGKKYDVPFYYSSDKMTIPSTGGSLNLGNIVIWDLQSKGIFGTSNFEHTTWAWKQTATVNIQAKDLQGYSTSTHEPYVLVTLKAVFTDAVNYSWKQTEVKLFPKKK